MPDLERKPANENPCLCPGHGGQRSHIERLRHDGGNGGARRGERWGRLSGLSRAAPGTSGYLQCRMLLRQQHVEQTAIAAAQAQAQFNQGAAMLAVGLRSLLK